ncbi:hypothetical protein [Paenibacillus sp. NPDC058174]|uniref:hypothetical protein n=1 Tax=Paenibacillus sp. NPDC058174 TaxID=3346366 RepID=UPI0036DC14D6
MSNELNYLSGLPVHINEIPIYPLSLKEIAGLGEPLFNIYLGCLLINDNHIPELKKLNIDVFDYLCVLSTLKYEDGLIFKSALELVTKCKIEVQIIDDKVHMLLDEKFILDRKTFSLIQLVIREQYFLSDSTPNHKFNPANDKARELKEKLDKIKNKLSKDNKDNQINLNDIISIVASYTPNLNILDVWNLTVYQLYHLYIRLIMKDTYESEFQQLLQGADPKKLTLKHWIAKVEGK